MTSEERIAKLETQIENLEAEQKKLLKQLSEAQLDQWQGRIDDLEVQMHLGAMEANDRLSPLLEQLRSKWADARRQFEDVGTTAGGVAETLRAGVQNAYKELQKAVAESRNRMSS